MGSTNQPVPGGDNTQTGRTLPDARRSPDPQHPDLSAVAKIKKLEGFSQIEYGDNHWNVVAADPDSADGVNGHCLADELHRWKGFEFFNALKWMLASQPEGVFAGITTAGSEMQSVCRQLHEKTKAVNAGRQVDESHYGVIYAASPDDDPHEEATWFKANPSLGTDADAPLKLSTFRQDYEAAKNEPRPMARVPAIAIEHMENR